MDESDFIQRARELATIVESSHDPIIGKRLDGTITSWNHAAEELYGYTSEEVVGRSIALLEPPERKGEIDDFLERVRRGERLVNLETVRVRKDGTPLDVRLTISPIEVDGEIVGASTIVRDLTEQRRLEETVRRAQRMEAVARLAGGIAHDFNNLLVVIRGNAQLLADRSDGELRDIAHQIEVAGERASSLTRQLLAFSRQRVLRMETLDPNEVVENMLGLLRPVLPENITIETNLDPEIGAIDGDRSELANAILNLAINARDAMPDGGTLQIRTAPAEVTAKQATGELPPGRFVLLQVTDSGTGMDAETSAQAFDPFFTTKADGTGLGLPAVYGLVTQSGGHITLYSEPGFGTTFRLYLPVTTSARPRAEPMRESGSPTGTECILLVEDNEMVRDLAATALTALGYRVLAVATADEALALAESRLGDFDLLLTDVVMPGMNGRELADRLVAARPGLKVLFTSGYPADTILRLGIAESAVSFIEKPYLPDQLGRAVRSSLDQGPAQA